MNDERFFDLAMKVIARQATDAERAELDGLLSREPEFRVEFVRLETDVRMAKGALPLVDATLMPVAAKQMRHGQRIDYFSQESACSVCLLGYLFSLSPGNQKRHCSKHFC